MDDRRKCMILGILCLALAIVTIALASALAAKSTLPPQPEPHGQIEPQSPTKDETQSPSTPSVTDIPTTKPVTDPPTPETPWQQIRLPREVLPSHYDIHLIPDLKAGTFTGNVDIHIRVLSSTSYVIVHFAYLNVTSLTLKEEQTSREVELLRHFVFEKNEVLVVESSRTLSTGNYTLHVDYNGSLVGSLVGFYRSSYVDPISNDTRYLAASKFEPTYARRAFPCFDEPALKATFQIRLTHQPEMNALSNMNIESTSESKTNPGLMETSFSTSVKMSTYLVVFVVSEFKFTENKTNSGKPFRVYSRPDQINSTNHALNVGVQVLNYYEQYFNIAYPLPKQDLIAIPDFVSGAMENWGLITFRETSLLYNEKNVASSQKKSIANTIAHELTHQWFGNLVTMEWWDDLWLNEGFATFFAYEGVSHLQETESKNWRQSAEFLLENLHESLVVDSSLSSHPIIQPVHHPDEITSIFDSISYSKGSSVIRMLEAFIGQDLFKKGLHKYLNDYAYSNAKTENLWRIMTSEKPDTDVAKVMDTWTKQMGYPVVYVEKQGNKVIANQTRFLEDITLTLNVSESPYNYLWEIPLTYKVATTGEVKMQWMHMEQQISWEEPGEIVKFNVDQTGVFRVNYDANQWNRLIEETCKFSSDSALSMADVTNLIDDSFALFYNGMLSPEIFFKFCKCLSTLEHYEMWSIATDGLNSIFNLIKHTREFSLFRNFALNLVTPVYNHVAWTNITTITTYEQIKLQRIVINFACGISHAQCLEESSKKLDEWLIDPNSVPADIQGAVFNNGLRAAGAKSIELWEKIWSRYLIEPAPQTKRDLLHCLTTTSSPWLLMRLLESVFNETEIRSQNAVSVIAGVAWNPVGEPIAWHFYRENWERLVNKYTLNDRNLGKLILSVTSSFTSETSLLEMMAFFKKYPDAGAGERARKQALDHVKGNIKWIQLRKDELITQLHKI